MLTSYKKMVQFQIEHLLHHLIMSSCLSAIFFFLLLYHRLNVCWLFVSVIGDDDERNFLLIFTQRCFIKSFDSLFCLFSTDKFFREFNIDELSLKFF